MALTRAQWRALIGAAGFAVVAPTLALFPYPILPRPSGQITTGMISPAPVPAVAAIYERELFSPADSDDRPPADAPALVGIAGRLNRDAVALVRLADGGSRSLAVGESVEGWRLESLAIDAAFFTRGRERVRAALAGEDAAAGEVPN